MKYHAIIIGGGLAGLTAGATLTFFGKKVLLLEQHHKPGGCATTFKRNEFIVEVGLHEMSGVFEGGTMQRIFDMLEVTSSVDLVQIPEFYATHTKHGKFVMPHGVEAAQNALIEAYPEDEKGIKRFFKVIFGIRNETLRLPRSRFMNKIIYPLMPMLFPNIVEASKHTVASWLDQYLTDEQLKIYLLAHIAYWGDDPDTLSMFYFGMATSGFIKNGGHFIKGGSQQLSSHLASFIENHGGRVLLGKKAEKIITEHGQATAVTFSDAFDDSAGSETIACDSVIANCAMPTVPELLNEPFKSDLQSRLMGQQKSLSLLCVYLGFRSKLDHLGVQHYSNVYEGDDVHTVHDIKANHQGDWSQRRFIFVDYGQVDAGLSPSHKSEGVICVVSDLKEWHGLSHDAYQAQKERVADLLIERLEKHLPGIKDCIEYREVSTPATVERYTSNPDGAIYGYAQVKGQIGNQRFRNNFLLPNLYFASAWAFPGGGFEGSVTGGFLAALQMNKDQSWSDILPDHLVDHREVSLLLSQSTAEGMLVLNFEMPIHLDVQKGQYCVVRMKNPPNMELDLPYRWLAVESVTDDGVLTFRIDPKRHGLSSPWFEMKPGDQATIFGPMTH